ncbi:MULTISPECIES: hypothetical protein [Sinobaca]|uniref:Uncharacterized protein n=1 Tax=Sinobaca qinghaiensis TaxID=342944 RepID=A0A419UWK0_9BACL|nr:MULTISPECIES: hypothetical protein [Sinobaca]RKD69508.1 hypothetical protein ATL39_2927 [Sinobaca qinghaiensis]
MDLILWLSIIGALLVGVSMHRIERSKNAKKRHKSRGRMRTRRIR